MTKNRNKHNKKANMVAELGCQSTAIGLGEEMEAEKERIYVGGGVVKEIEDEASEERRRGEEVSIEEAYARELEWGRNNIEFRWDRRRCGREKQRLW